MASFAEKMVAGRRILKGETTKEKVAKEMSVSESTVSSWVRAVKQAAVNEHTGKEYQLPKTKAKVKKKTVLKDPEVTRETPTKPTVVAPSAPQAPAKKEEEEWDII